MQKRVLAAIVWFALGMMLLSRISINIVDLDIFHQMALVREGLAMGHLPTIDTFSYGPTLPKVIHHEWGAGAVAYFLATRFGASGILLLKYLLGTLLAIFCLATAKARTSDPLPAFSILAPVAILFVGGAFSPVRAHLYSMVFVAALLFLLDRDRHANRRWIVVWLPLTVVWFNLHAGATVGILLLGAHAFEQLLRGSRRLFLLVVAAGMLAAAAVNPYGVYYYPYLWEALRMSRPAIAEWRPLWEGFPSFYAVVFLLSLLLLIYLATRIGIRAMPGIVILCATGAAAALHVRMLPFYGIAWICYVPAYLAAAKIGARFKSLFENPPLLFQAAWLMAAVFFLNVAVTYRPWNLEIPAAGTEDQVVFPTGAVQYLADQKFRGNAMFPFEYGAYASWKLYPSVRVAVDSRYEVAYPGWWVDEVLRLYRCAGGWQKTLTRFPTDVIVVRRSGALGREIAGAGWQRIYRDGSYAIYVRPGLELPSVDFQERVIAAKFP